MGLIAKTLKFLASRKRLTRPSGDPPASWAGIIHQNVALVRRLSPGERELHLKLTQLLVNDVPFEGCAGLEVTDEMRVTIGATACILLVNLPYPRFLDLRRVLIYPGTFVPVRAESRHAGIVESEETETLGEAWHDGIVILSWEQIEHDIANPDDGRNVLLHEFAHVLDHEDGYSDGVPVLDSAARTEEWSRVLRKEFGKQVQAVETDAPAPLDDYAATDPAEFFAVATEAFFEAPVYVRDTLPEVYRQLSRYFGQDPAA
jgi:Mlc titration factor MtfA (ptsG expression regulator)